MSVHGFSQALKAGHNPGQAVRFGVRRWAIFNPYIGARCPVCPYCGAIVTGKMGKIRHERYEARVQLILRVLGLDDLDPDTDILLEAAGLLRPQISPPPG